MIFPWAHCDLDNYWQKINPKPDLNDVGFLRWVSEQCVGLMEAVSVIHNPSHLTTDKRYGRHGDIKAENILWYRTGTPDSKGRGIFVISDLGLTAINSQKSRSMQPNKGLSTTPSYRPPECDIDGGKISRAFDIWTLGCLYLELLCWLLTGYEGKAAFDLERITPFIYGSSNDIFFDVERLASGGQEEARFVFRVKDVVSKVSYTIKKEKKPNGSDTTPPVLIMLIYHQKFSKLHASENCTPWAHSLLDIIENEMLVVLAEGRPRSTSDVLLRKLREMDRQCQKDQTYCLSKVPDDTRLRNWTRPNGVLAKLNSTAQGHVETRQDFLRVNDQDIRYLRKSLQKQEWDRMDVCDPPTSSPWLDLDP